MNTNFWKIGTIIFACLLIGGLGFFLAQTFTNNSRQDSSVLANNSVVNTQQKILPNSETNRPLDNPQRTETQLPTPKKEGVVSIEAGLVFQSGDIKPVARTMFYLLDESAVKLMRQSGVKSSDGGKSDIAIAGAYGISSKFNNNPNASRANALIKKHSIQSVTTDFGGKAKFPPVPQGSYYLFGISSTPKGFSIWDVKINLNATETSVTLDQNNAVAAF